jgi:diguanylate cyclase (GGDEF)-like protein
MDRLKEPNLRKSLRTRYLMIASLVGLMLVGSSIFASLYVKSVTSSNSETLQLRDKVTQNISNIRNAIWQQDAALNALLIKPEPTYEEIIKQNLAEASKFLDVLGGLKPQLPEDLSNQISDLHQDHHALEELIGSLMELRQDPNWVYPMLPYIRGTLVESHTEFITDIDIAITETLASDTKASRKLALELIELKDRWQEMILNFRAVIIRFAGLNSRGDTPQEMSVRLLHEQVEDHLIRFEQLIGEDVLGLETEEALVEMRFHSDRWMKHYQELKKIRESNFWREDLRYLEVNIRPYQVDIFQDLNEIENWVSQWSKANVKGIELAANQINLGLWGLTALALSFVVLVYLMIDRSVLAPVRKMANAISTEGRHIEHLTLPERGSQEIATLIHSFNSMRSQIHQRQLALEHQALHDSLTGLPNRALLQDRLDQDIHRAHRQKKSMALMLLDLDHFKEINDTLGHPVGDQVLKKIGQRLSDYLRESDTVARLGGDEFAIIATDIDEDDARIFVEKIILAIKQVVHVDKQNLYVGASIGVAMYPDHGQDVATLVRHVDIAMYHAKHNNLDYAFYDSSMNGHSVDNLSLLGELHTELLQQTGQLQLYYQPQIDLFTREVLGVEALLRWIHPTRGLIPPDEVVRMAEQSGLIAELTYWVLETAIADCATWQKDLMKLNVAVNLSAWNLQDPVLPEVIEKLLKRSALNPEFLTLEITESAVMSDPVRARQVLNKLNHMGMKLLIDDFGTGFSSLAYLKLLPVKGLKIDKSFVLEMSEDENDAIIVKSTIDLAHNLGLIVVAEGVETMEASLWLRQHKCDSSQGFHLARPMPEPEFRDWLQSYQTMAVL